MSLLEASGLLIGDKGYIDSQLERQLSSYAINLQTPKRSNMKDKTSKGFVYLINRFRRLIETVIGQLCERFNFEKVLDERYVAFNQSPQSEVISSYGLCLA